MNRDAGDRDGFGETSDGNAEGLSALLGLSEDAAVSSRSPYQDVTIGDERVFELVDIERIRPNEFQPRERFVEAELADLAASISELGVLQPVLLRRLGHGEYELIAGERRWRAAQLAGLSKMPAIVRDVDDRASLEQAVVENLHRADLNPLEEAAAYRQLMDDFALTQELVAQRVGKSRSAVANVLRLFQLPEAVQRLVASGQLTAGHARALLAFPDRRLQIELAGRVVRDGLSVRAVEDLIRAASVRSGQQSSADGEGSADEDGADEHGRSSGSRKAPAALEIELALAERLDTTVEVVQKGTRGRLVIEFADADDLDRLYRLLS